MTFPVSSPSLLELDAAPPLADAVQIDHGEQEHARLPLDLVAIALVLIGATAVTLQGAGWRGVWDVLLIVGGTCISEDLTCLTVGNLLGDGRVAVNVGLAACFLGIVLSDAGIWAIGKYAGRPLLGTRRLAPIRRRLLGRRKSGTARRWLKGRVAAAMMICRFVPGMRVPTYFLAGAWGVDLRRFLVWSMLAAGLWVPLIVLIVAQAGGAIARPLEAYLGGGIVTLLISVVFGLALLRASGHVATSKRYSLWRLKMRARIERVWRWEFWPPYIFYLPLLPYVAYLALRYGGWRTISAANPGIPKGGGFLGESKAGILAELDQRYVLPLLVLPPGDGQQRAAELARQMSERAWQFPIVLKPDVGQRGRNVQVIHDAADAERYLAAHPRATMAQVFHPGPFEAGVFYYRFPGEPAGRILSITDKHFPQVLGDGTSTLEELIWSHPRYRMQGKLFTARHAADRRRILARGEVLRLTDIGNHCRGAHFRDGAHLITPALEKAIDEIARGHGGFHFGRFDIRYSSPEAFIAGEDLAVLELNGSSAEATDLYDPRHSLLEAYRRLFRQWRLLLQIGAAGRRHAG